MKETIALKKMPGWLLTALLVVLLYLCRDSMFAGTVLGFYPSQFLLLAVAVVLGLGFLVSARGQWRQVFRDRRLLLMGASCAVCLLPMVGKGDWQLMYCSVLFCLLLGIFFTFFTDLKTAARCYVGILAVLAVYSVLAAYILRLAVDGGIVSMPVFYNGHEIKFYNFFLSIVPDTYVKDRNFGIFREPGVYQFFLLLALYLNNDLLTWDRPWKQWVLNGIFGVTMISTFATGGVIEMGLLAVLLFFEKKWYQNPRLRLAAMGLTLGLVAVVLYCVVTKNGLYWAAYDMLYGKFLGDNESGPDRIQSITGNLRLFAGSPLVGRDLETVLHVSLNNTSSTGILLAGFGILMGAVHVLAWAALVWRRGRPVGANLAYLVILFMSFNTQNMIADVFLWLFPMMALAEKTLPLLAGKDRKAD